MNDAGSSATCRGGSVKVVWDAAEGGTGPHVKDGLFAIKRRGSWSRLLAMFLLNASVFGMAKATPSHFTTLAAAPNDMHNVVAQSPASATTVAQNCQHHDSHNDKSMQTLGGSHLDQHGDLSC